jgi:curved DNA-binding protein CbpA
VPAKTYYQLLDLAPTAATDEIKRAFRLQIARYHPDKVQHLGKEFQDMAAERAAELTEAYRILSDEGRRAAYDQSLSAGAADSAGTSPTAPAVQRPADVAAPVPPPPSATEPPVSKGPQFSQERATRDEFVRKALVGRLRQTMEMMGGYDEAEVRSFDAAWLPKSKMFARAKGPRLLARYVAHADGAAIADAWAQGVKWAGSDEVCVLLIGSTLATAGELARAIAEQRRKSRGAKATLIPVDARNWDAHLPTDAPENAKTLLSRVRAGR